MTTYTVKATIEVETELERDRVQSLIDSGVKELSGIGGRYGFDVKSATATVE